MFKRMKMAPIVISMAILLSVAAVSEAQKTNAVPTAPIPSQILTAKKVFIANGGGDESRFDAPSFSGGPDRLYNEFYASVKSWGRYELVSSPADADLVLEVQLNVMQPKRARLSSGDESEEYDAQFRLTVRDAKTQTVLWGITEHAESAILQSNRDKNFESALYLIVFEVKKIAGPANGGAAGSAPPGK